MTATDPPGLVDGVDVDRVADVVRACPGVTGLEGGTAGPGSGPVESYLPGRRVVGVRIERDRVTVQVTGTWGVPIPTLGRRIQTALGPLVGDRRIDVIVATLAGEPESRWPRAVAPAEHLRRAGPADAVRAGPVRPIRLTKGKTMTRAVLGTLVGLALGLAWAFGSFGQMLIVALLAVIGFVIGKVFDGDLDIARFVSDRRQNR